MKSIPLKKWTLRLRPLAAPCLSGALLAAAFPPLDQGWLAWIALAPLLVALARGSGWKAAGSGYLFGLVFYSLLLSWIGLFGGPAVVALVAVESLATLAFALLAAPLVRAGGWALTLGVPGIWVALEWIRGQGEIAFLWGQLGVSQHAMLVSLQAAAVGGVWAISWLVICVNCVIAAAWLRASPMARSSRTKNDGLGWSILAPTGIVVAALIFGVVRLWRSGGSGAVDRSPAAAPPVWIGMAQGNLNRDRATGQFIDPSGVLGTYKHLTEEMAKKGARLVLWPETADPDFVRLHRKDRDDLASLAKRAGVALLVGAFDRDAQGRVLNTLLPISRTGDIGTPYVKEQLVPFGEWVPLRRWLPSLEQFGVPAEDLGRGHGPGVVDLAGVRIGGLICFESTLPRLARARARDGAQLLAVATNDAWFRDTAAPAQHLAACAVRAVETGRPVVRSATTGITAAFDPYGRQIARLPQFESGYLMVDIQPRHGQTPFVRFGDWVVWLGVALWLLSVRSARKRGDAPDHTS